MDGGARRRDRGGRFAIHPTRNLRAGGGRDRSCGGDATSHLALGRLGGDWAAGAPDDASQARRRPRAHPRRAGRTLRIIRLRDGSLILARLYHIHGLPLETATGTRRRLLVASEWLSCRLATQVLAVSESVLAVARREGVCPASRGLVLGAGSINGVDTAHFSRGRVASAAEKLRILHGLAPRAPVVGFVGRLVCDKGIVTLAAAWSEVRQVHPDAVLLLVGDWEDEDRVPASTRTELEEDPRWSSRVSSRIPPLLTPS